jgi:peptidylprolyl isomerase
MRRAGLLLAGLLCLASAAGAAPPRPAAALLEASTPADWRAPDPHNTLYLELAAGRVTMELAPAFAPAHIANIRTLVRAGYFDGLAINRVQENYVVQWGDPAQLDPTAGEKRPFGAAKASLAPEFDRTIKGAPTFVVVPGPDGYAPETGFVQGFPAARDRKAGRMWLAHCTGALGVGRDDGADTGSGAELYVVIGHAPRHLDRNVTLVGRVLSGISLLTVLPRGTGALGFYETAPERLPIRAMRLAADVPEAERTRFEVLRTDTPLFKEWVDARRNRREPWFARPAGHADLCNIPVPVRTPA